MNKPLSLAVAGIGNNISALLQGVYYYRGMLGRGIPSCNLPGLRHFQIGNYRVVDIDFVAGFDIQPEKIGIPIETAIFCRPNNYPDLNLDIPTSSNLVVDGLHCSENGLVVGREQVVEALRRSRADVLLYSLPTGLQWAADGYAECALEAGVGFVNCTPEIVARNPEMLRRFDCRGLALLGDDLASQMGTSMLHRAILDLLLDRGLHLENTYQINLGGNEDFRNLRENGETKAVSKKNALSRPDLDLERVHIIPSAGFVPHLNDRKVAYVNVSGRGWADTPMLIDLKLEVQDSSNAAGVIIDLIRIAGTMQRLGESGFSSAAASFLKSPPLGHSAYGREKEAASFARLNVGEEKVP